MKVIFSGDFNVLLNAFASMRDMKMAHCVMACKECTSHASSLSPVTRIVDGISAGTSTSIAILEQRKGQVHSKI